MNRPDRAPCASGPANAKFGHPGAITPDAVAAMRAWALDCQWADIEGPEDLAEMTDYQIVCAIQRHYGGGLMEFLRTMD